MTMSIPGTLRGVTLYAGLGWFVKSHTKFWLDIVELNLRHSVTKDWIAISLPRMIDNMMIYHYVPDAKMAPS